MNRLKSRLAALALVLALALMLGSPPSEAAFSGIYITAVNERVLELNDETMPFLSDGVLYVSNSVFDGNDLEVRYMRNNSMGLAVLYTNTLDLRFNLEESSVSDKDGNTYTGHAIERNGYVFFPLDLVCRVFGLDWSYNKTEIAPLIRITSDAVILSDASFISAAEGLMQSRYNDYTAKNKPSAVTPEAEKPAKEETVTPPVSEEVVEETVDPPAPAIEAADGQRVYLIAASKTTADTRAALEVLGSTPATFLLTVEQMEDGDLVRSLIAAGHNVALLSTDGRAEDVGEEMERARTLLWDAGCYWLDLVWYEGSADITVLLEDLGFARVQARLDRRGTPLTSEARAERLLYVIASYRDDVSVYLGPDGDTLEGLPTLLTGLQEAGFTLSGWRAGM